NGYDELLTIRSIMQKEMDYLMVLAKEMR
ncbi:hypothetical protein A1W7_04333, partial [Escherichia coli KTE87]